MPRKLTNSSYHLHAKKKLKRTQAEIRQVKYDSLSIDKKIASCDPNGSKRQLKRLMAMKADVPVKQYTAPVSAPATKPVKPKITKK